MTGRASLVSETGLVMSVITVVSFRKARQRAGFEAMG
jgi:hypothetical protein